ncbi:hypothetical protein SEA_ELEPHANTOON_51 [Mycobacterium phage Elephantoon]|nr:hypothetical protein SEA_ELEPHANTOON_51 [Mycobacterium phage Elephantoon]
MKVGSKVTVERDEEKYPSNRVWRQFSGKQGVITTVVRGVGPVEYGVTFTRNGDTDAYFKAYELTERK